MICYEAKHLLQANLESSFKIYIWYRARAIISRSRLSAADFELKNEEFPFLVHKLSAI